MANEFRFFGMEEPLSSRFKGYPGGTAPTALRQAFQTVPIPGQAFQGPPARDQGAFGKMEYPTVKETLTLRQPYEVNSSFEKKSSPAQNVAAKMVEDFERRGLAHGIQAPPIGAFRGKPPQMEVFERSVNAITDAITDSAKYFDNIGVSEDEIDRALAEMLGDAQAPKKMSAQDRTDFLINMGLNMMARGGQPGSKNAGVLGVMGASGLAALDIYRKERLLRDKQIQRIKELGLARLDKKEQRAFEKDLASAEAKYKGALTGAETMMDLQKEFLRHDERMKNFESRLAGQVYSADVGFEREKVRAAAKTKGGSGKSDLNIDDSYMQGLTEDVTTALNEDEFQTYDTPELREKALQDSFFRKWREDALGGGTTRGQKLIFSLKQAKDLKDLDKKATALFQKREIQDWYNEDANAADRANFERMYEQLKHKLLLDSLGLDEQR